MMQQNGTQPIQVVVTAQGNELTIGSNIAQSPEAWLALSRILYTALGQTLQRMAEEQAGEGPKGPPLITIPHLNLKR